MEEIMENKEEQSYLDLVRDVFENGDDRPDRTGTNTRSIPHSSRKYSLLDNTFPLFTSRQLFPRPVFEEWSLFIKGDCDTKTLEEKNVNIWRGNTSRAFLDSRNLHHLPEGNLGKGYPFQYRNFGGEESPVDYLKSDKRTGVDQIKMALHKLKTDPFDRRIMVLAFNPKQNDESALPACHYSFLFYVSSKKELTLTANIRSSDLILGYSFNLPYYALMAHVFAKASGMTAKEVIINTGDTHIYHNLFPMVEEQIRRKPYPFPKINIKKDISTVEDMENLKFEDIEIIGYKYHPKLVGKMSI